MITFKEHLKEHCKKGEYFKAFNYLQVKILRALYENHLKDRVEGFGDFIITSNSELLMMFFENLPTALSLLGDVMCPHIPDEKTLKHSTNDVNAWGEDLYNLLKNHEDI